MPRAGGRAGGWGGHLRFAHRGQVLLDLRGLGEKRQHHDVRDIGHDLTPS